MALININVETIQLRRNTDAYWTAQNPTPAAGEPIYSTDTNEIRIGDGSTAWSSLTAISGGGGGSLTQEQVEDYVNGLLTGTSYVTTTYDDVGGSLTIDLASAYKTILDNTSNTNTGDETGAGIVSKIDTELGQTDWKAAVNIPTGGTTGQILKKDSNANYDYSWQDDDDTDTTTAVGISITDAGAYFTGTDVEAALQELGAGGGGGDTVTVNDYRVETPTGNIDSANTTYTTSVGEYKTGTLIAYLNNSPITVGQGLTEGDPSLGTFDISPAPETGDTLYVTYITTDAGSLTTGETNTASNLAGDEGIYYDKSGTTLRFKSLTAGTNISLSSTNDAITINSTGGGGGTVDVVSNVATSTILGRTTAGSGDSEELTASQVRTLLNIEDGATADQDASEIRALVESATDSNVFTDADHSKLDGIETSATADQTGAEIKSLYEAEADTNAFTDAEQTKLSGIETNATADQTGTEIVSAIDTELGQTTWKTGASFYTDTPTPSPDGIITQFTVGQSEYTAQTLEVYVDGQTYVAGQGLTETTPGSGIFTLDSAPITGATLTARYGVAGASTGEANTASNLAGDEGIFSSKSSLDLQFKSLTAGTNISLSSDANAITIDVDSHTHATTDITSGTFADARIAESNVTQHEAALSIADSQITDHEEVFIIACSDLTSDLETGTSVAYFRVPFACTVTAVRASVLTAPTGSAITVDINESGTTILGTKLTIDATEKTSTTAASAATITDSSLADDSEITIDIDAIGSTVAGAGLQVQIHVTR